MSKKSVTIAIAGVCLYSAAVLIPPFIRARNTSSPNACVNNLRQLDGAQQQRALENHKASTDVATWDNIRPYLKEIPKCSDGGTYSLGRVIDPPTCSIGSTREPSHSLLP